MAKMKEETKKMLLSKIAEGPTASWLWEDVLLESLKLEGMDCKGREAEVAEYAARAVRGYYPNRKGVWDAAFLENPAADVEFSHILSILTFQRDFTLANRPVRPKVEKPEGKAKGKSEPKAGAPVPPPPPAPPAPPSPAIPAKPEMAKAGK